MSRPNESLSLYSILRVIRPLNSHSDFQFVPTDNLILFGQELWHVPSATDVSPRQPIAFLLSQVYNCISGHLRCISQHCRMSGREAECVVRISTN